MGLKYLQNLKKTPLHEFVFTDDAWIASDKVHYCKAQTAIHGDFHLENSALAA